MQVHAGEHDHAHGPHDHGAVIGGGVLRVGWPLPWARRGGTRGGLLWRLHRSARGDAVHKFSDVPALLISWLAAVWSQLPADSQRTYGYRRAGTLAAFINGILLVCVALGLFYQAFDRFRHPSPCGKAG